MHTSFGVLALCSLLGAVAAGIIGEGCCSTKIVDQSSTGMAFWEHDKPCQPTNTFKCGAISTGFKDDTKITSNGNIELARKDGFVASVKLTCNEATGKWTANKDGAMVEINSLRCDNVTE